MPKQNKDIADKTAENITKNLFNQTFYEKNNNEYENEYEYEEINNEDIYEYEEEYEEDIYDDDIYEKNYRDKKSKYSKAPKNTPKNKYRKNIDKYGKNFFQEDYEEEPEKFGFSKILNFAIIGVLVISTSVLAFSLIKTKKEISNLKEENKMLIDKNKDAENKLLQDSLKNQISELESKNEELENIISGKKPTNSEKQTEISSSNSSNNSSPTKKPNSNKTNSSNNSNFSEYTVKENDSFWKISKEVYGNGSQYQKILDANNLKENSQLTPGQKLKIPKLN